MAEEQKPVHESKVKEVKPKTRQELLDADDETLTNEELTRKILLVDLDQKKIQVKVLQHQNAKFQMTEQEQKDKFTSRGRELRKTDHDQKKHQDQCSHRKGGRGLEGLQKGGSAADYAVIRHTLPTNEMWQRCQRCGKTWRPPHVQDFDIKTDAGKAAFEEAKKVYKDALSWPTDNIPSSGITFGHQSDDGNKSANDFVHEVMSGTNLR